MKQWILKKFYRPMLFFFLLPVFYLILGNIFALQYDTFKVVPFILLYLFILTNQMLENILLRVPNDDFRISKPFFSSLELLNVLLLLYFGLYYSWLAALVSLLYTLIIQMQFVFNYYDLEFLIIFVVTFLKLLLLNLFSFYTQTNFIHPRFIPIYLGLFIPFYLFEVSRTERRVKNTHLLALLTLSYVMGVFCLWEAVGWPSLILLLSFPLVDLCLRDFNRKTSSTLALAFSLIYTFLILFPLTN